MIILKNERSELFQWGDEKQNAIVSASGPLLWMGR